MSQANLVDLIKNVPLFSQFTSEEIESLAESTQALRLQKGEKLFYRGETGHMFYHVTFGRVKLYLPGANEQEAEKVFRIVESRESFAEAVVFLKKDYPVNAETLEDSLLLSFKTETIFQLMQSKPALAAKMIAGLSMRIHTLHHEIESLRIKSGMERFAYYIISLANQLIEGSQKIHLPTTKQNIASLLNIKPETFSRYLGTLEKNNLICVDGRDIEIIDLSKLKEFAKKQGEQLRESI